MSFEDIKGQDEAIGLLKGDISAGRIFSSYLFTGPEGIGKALAAKKFAKAINCADRAFAPCERCVSCKRVDSESHPDVFFVRPKGASRSIGIREIREAITRASLKPYEAGKKVFVIDNADSMNQEAANAFLKTLEEPPAETLFVLIATSEKALLPTIVSRCLTIRFSQAEPKEVERFIMDKFSVTEEKAAILTSFSSGRIGKAVKMHEENLLEKKNGLIGKLSSRDALLDELLSYDGRDELKEKLEILLSYFRDIMLYKSVGGDGPFYNIDRIQDIKNQAGRFTKEKLRSVIQRIITLQSYVDYNVNPKLIVDVLVNEVSSSECKITGEGNA